MPLSAELFQKISSMDINELLALLVTGKLAKEGVVAVRKRIRNLWNQRKCGFTPNAEEAATIYKVGQKEAYKRLKECVGSHWSLRLIRLGLYISDLNDEGQRKLVAKTKGDIYKKYGSKGIKITNMATTGALSSVIEYLSKLKIEENLNRTDLAIIFDTEIIEVWDKITFFVKTEDSEKGISKKIVRMMNQRIRIFFVFAYGAASIKPMKVISKLSNDGTISNKNYHFSMISRKDKANWILYTWTFELIKPLF